jgi:predicted esterase
MSLCLSLTICDRFDIYSFRFDTAEDEKGMPETVEQLNGSGLIKDLEEANAGISPNRIVLGGFSQGAAMVLFTGLTKEYQLSVSLPATPSSKLSFRHLE